MSNISEEYFYEQLFYQYPEMDISQTLDLVRNVMQLRKHVAEAYRSSDDESDLHISTKAAIQFYNDEIKRLIGLL
jgi:hypothetical protein